MQDLYSQKDLELLGSRLKKRTVLLLAAAAVLLCALVWSLIIRNKWLSMALLILTGAVVIFCYDLFLAPLAAYRRLLRGASAGRVHTGVFEFSSCEAETSMVDGVPCRGLIFLGEPDKHGSREQRFYWDQEIPLPDFREGDQIELKYTGKSIIGYRLTEAR